MENYETITLEETYCFSSFFLDYIREKPFLQSFYNAFPTIDNFEKTIVKRDFAETQRKILYEVLQCQYEDLSVNNVVSQNIISLLNANTFTITTGHQLNIFTGPLYFIYKIVTVINTCKQLKKKYPKNHFVPVYWMASEDHDFEEIQSFFLYGKKHSWHSYQKGAVGRFHTTGLQELCKYLPKTGSFFKEAYQSKNLANAVRFYVNHLFEKEGLIVIDADNERLKGQFIPVIQSDVLENKPFYLVSETTDRLHQLNYKTQVSPREINLFFLEDSLRERIVREGDVFKVLNTDRTFTQEEMESLITKSPEKFSPNVILRPLYQETILPNLAYVGGPSEIVYWLQLKAVFEAFETPFPMLQPRNFSIILPPVMAKKWLKTRMDTSQLFLPTNKIIELWLKKYSNVDLSYRAEVEGLSQLFLQLKDKCSQIDATLIQHIEALHTVTTNKILKAEKKLTRSEKRKHREKKQQIEAVKAYLFPDGTLQERKDNFMNFYGHNDQFIDMLLNTFDPFNFQMYLLKP